MIFIDIPLSWATCPGARGWSTGSGSNRPGWYKNSFADASHCRCVRRHPTPTSPPLQWRLLTIGAKKKSLDLAPAVAYAHSCWEVAMSFSTYICIQVLCLIVWWGAAGPGTTTGGCTKQSSYQINNRPCTQRSKASNKNTTNKKENDVILLKKGNNYLYLLPKIWCWWQEEYPEHSRYTYIYNTILPYLNEYVRSSRFRLSFASAEVAATGRQFVSKWWLSLGRSFGTKWYQNGAKSSSPNI